MLTTIGFDADDTLWHNETFFRLTQARFVELLAKDVDVDHLEARLSWQSGATLATMALASKVLPCR